MPFCRPISRQQLLSTLGRAQVVTVNQRLARALRDAYADAQLAADVAAWRQPSITSWDHWQEGLLELLAEDDRLLSDVQELQLWQQVVSEGLTPELRLRLQVPATARMAREAHHLLTCYDVDFPPHAASEDHRMFLTWRKAYQQSLASLEALERSQLSKLLFDAFVRGALQPPEQLVIAGFDDLRPDQRALLEGLADLGTSLHSWVGENGGSARQTLVAADDPADEVRLCARWARARLEQGAVKVGIVLCEPQYYRTTLYESLLAELAPQVLLEGGRADGLLSFSLGDTLAEVGVVAAALQLLVLGNPLHFNDISYLLRSPWIGDLSAEGGERMRFEADLRDSGELYWSPRALAGFKRRKATRRGSPSNPLSALASLLSKALAQGRTPLPASAWASELREYLGACGWPGQRPLNSRDYQARSEFFELFDELATLDRLGRNLSRGEAVAFISRRAQERSFQIKEATGAVQVMGLLEATGLEFEHLWVLGLHDAAFPAAPRPNPFIPVPLQRDQRMPHADASREFEFATQVASRLFSAAPEVMLSYPRQTEGSERHVSPLVDIGESPFAASESCAPEVILRKQRAAMQQLSDCQAPPINSNKPVTGGTALLKDQALCPFRAFARHRLRSEELTRLDIGLNALQRGTLVHSLLEIYWRAVADSARLEQQTFLERENSLREAARKALARFLESVHDLPSDLRVIEEERLVALGLEWLAVEDKREPFSVEELEKRYECSIGTLVIRTQIDRIDRLASGESVIIDYKTGKPDPLQWLEQRIAEPQLPVYVHNLPAAELAAVLFAQVRSG
ncbi:MAG: hypothetical protein C0624_01080, partial [Desulfuromonas sp.]